MMITIGICEDRKETREMIKSICRESINSLQLECEIIEFTDGEKLVSYQKVLDILILDIELPKISGIDVKNRLQEERTETLIIFVTNHEELIQEAFGINVIGFVNKSNMEIQLVAILELALRMNQFIIIEGRIDSRDILCIKADHGYCNFIMKNKGNILLHKSLDDLEQLLQKVDFIRIHRCCLVNLKWVRKLDKKQIDVAGEKLPVSVRQWANVKKKYAIYCKANARYC